MGLELAYVAIVFVDTTCFGCRDRPFVASCPFTEHARGVAIILENLGDDNVSSVVWFLSYNVVVAVVAIFYGACISPIFVVTPHVGVTCVLTRHEGGAGRCRNGAARVGLSETHALGGQAVEIGSGNVLLAVAAHVGISHVVAHNVDNVGALLCLHRSSSGN